MYKRVHVYYGGRVQGVGFRMTAEEIARQLGVTGWAKNLRDGRVEVVVEGEEAILNEFLAAIRTSAMKNFIHRVELSWSHATGEFHEFDIRYF
ncbi:MAG: acylphosphatase [Candidatus Omnitrophica bacterium]|nr:acylphosphatase [Candidatus Omnitrophota bacterium]